MLLNTHTNTIPALFAAWENEMKYKINNMKITKEKLFYEGHLKAFAEHIFNEHIVSVDFEKNNGGNSFSICLMNDRRCVDEQKFFSSKEEMLGYVVAYNEANGWHGFDTFNRYKDDNNGE